MSSISTSASLAETLLSDNPPGEPNRESFSPTTAASAVARGSASTMSLPFCLTVTIAALPMLLFGFNTGVLNAPEKVIFPGHSVLSWSLAVSAFCVGGFAGSANAGRLADRHGRRIILLLIFVVNAAFGILQVITPSMSILIAARVGVGLAGGASTVLTPMYLSEIAPQAIKGSIGTLTQLACVLGILVSILYALPFCAEDTWRAIFVPLPVVSLAGLLLGFIWLPESPRWLLLNHYNTRADEARATIRQFRNFQHEEDEEAVEMEVLLMTNNGNTPSQSASFEEATHQEDHDDGNTEEEAQLMSFKNFALDPENRIALVSSILFPVAQQLSGINAVFYYSTLFFDGVISNPEMGTVVAFAVNLLATVFALLLMDKLGRKTLLSLSAGGMGVCCIFLTLSLLGILPPIITVLCVMLYISFFELGLGSIPFFLASELIQPQFLGTVQSISMASNWFSNFCVGLLFPLMDKHLGAYTFVPFGIVLFGTVWYALWILPETRGKTLEMVLEELRTRQPQRIPRDEREQTALPIDNNESEVL